MTIKNSISNNHHNIQYVTANPVRRKRLFLTSNHKTVYLSYIQTNYKSKIVCHCLIA